MSTTLGNRIITSVSRADKALVQRFRGIPSSNIGDMMNRLYCMNGKMKCYSTNRAMLGSAITVKIPEGDNVLIHVAMDLCEPGDIIIVDGHGYEGRALIGEMMMTHASHVGVEGFVIDGAVRDVDCLEHIDISLYAKAVTPQGPYKNGTGEINVPVCCGGVVVFPGDIVIGDSDGICVVPQAEAAAIAELAENKLRQETETLERYARGDWSRERHGKKYLEICKDNQTFMC